MTSKHTTLSSGDGSRHAKNASKDLSWLYLPGELEWLYESYQPQPGDVLLLDSNTLTGAASRVSQPFGKYSHVGMVIGSDLYIDAISKEGVRVRRLAEITEPEHHYSIEKCIVARNRDVVFDLPDVFGTAMEYFERPYKLYSVFMRPGGALEERDPVICSKLVAMILKDIGKGLARPVQKTLPKHFDAISKGSNWRRFSLKSYDLLKTPGCVTAWRQGFTDSWFSLVEPLHGINKSFKALKRRAKRRGGDE